VLRVFGLLIYEEGALDYVDIRLCRVVMNLLLRICICCNSLPVKYSVQPEYYTSNEISTI
jgi:hypothetical protein